MSLISLRPTRERERVTSPSKFLKLPSTKITGVILVVFLFFSSFFFFSTQTYAVDWYSSSWSYRVSVTIDSAQVSADLTNFPVYVDFSTLPAGFHTNVNQTDARDIRVTKSDGTTEVAREVVWYDADTNTGELHFNASTTLSSTASTTFYLYYGNSGASEPVASSTYGSQNVWTDYAAVYHMQDESGNLTDSTSNTFHMTAGGTPTYGVAGKIGKGIEFNSANGDHFLRNDYVADYPTTLSAWGNSNSSSTAQVAVAVGRVISASTYYGRLFWDGANEGDYIKGGLREGYAENVASSPSGYSVDTFEFGTYRLWTNTSRHAFINGSVGAINNLNRLMASFEGFTVGANAQNTPSTFFSGILDEVRVAQVALSDAYIGAEYNNQNTPETFYSVGIEEEITFDIILSTTTLSILEGSQDTYAIVLDTQPTNDVEIYLTSTSTDISIDVATSTFTTENWDTPQTITVIALADEGLADREAIITHTASSTDTNYDNFSIDDVIVTIQDVSAPTVSITSPSTGTIITGTTTLTASSTDDGTVEGVQFNLNGTHLSDEVTATSAPDIYSFDWDTTTVDDGEYTILAVARDNEANLSTSTAITVNVANNASTTNSITQYGITWTFADTHFYGQFANGDYWVVGPVTITDIDTATTSGRSGWEVNPNSHSLQPYDDRAGGYDASLQPDFPTTVQATSSVVATISGSYTTASQSYIQTAAVLTVVPEIPPGDGADVFRPPYYGTEKPYYYVSDMDLSLLPSLAPVASTPTLSSIADAFRKVQLDHKADWTGRAIHPKDSMPDYGAEVAQHNAKGALRLMLNDSLEDKREAGIMYVQAGIDLYQMLKTGQAWSANGGHNAGRKLPILFTGVVLGNQEIKDAVTNASSSTFQEDSQIHFYQQANDGNGMVFWGQSDAESTYWSELANPGTGNKALRDPYGYIDGGSTLPSAYQSCCTSQPFKAQSIAARLLPGGAEIMNSQNLHDYVERWVTVGTWAQPDLCAPYDGNWSNYGVTFGPDGSGGCILDTDDSDGIGRLPDLHGLSANGGGYGDAFNSNMYTAYHASVDISKPIITAVSTGTPTATSTTITWTTNEASDSQVDYGITAVYGSQTTLDATLETSHSVTLSNLSPNTTYYFRVRSSDANGNLASSSNATFATVEGEAEEDLEPTPDPTPTPAVTPTRTTSSGSGYTSSSQVGQITSSPNFGQGASNSSVKTLQQILNTLGFTVATTGFGSPGQETDYFGTLTRAALARYQQYYGIQPALGYFGPLTKAHMAALARSGQISIPTQITTSASSGSQATRGQISPPVPVSTLTNQITFTRPLHLNFNHPDIKQLQTILNELGFTVSTSGAGSPGSETTFFGPATLQAVRKFQLHYQLVTTPSDPGYGFVGPKTRGKLNELLQAN